jgi:hypothetical protein
MNLLGDLQTTLDELNVLKETLYSKIRQEGRRALEEGFAKVFKQHPEILSITWMQFTPYFNDGDACTFSVNEPDFEIEGEKSSELEDFLCDLSYQILDAKKVLEWVFGDHIRVTVTPEGITTDYCHHE